MSMKTCMNIACGTTSCAEWKTGWVMRSGELANLCDKCGYAFEQQIYCEEFHTDDAGWRNCATCGKRLHCGCIASLNLIVLLERGGVKCLGCARTLRPNSVLNGNVGIVTHKNIPGSNVNDLYMNAARGLLRQDGLAFPSLDNFTLTPPPPVSMDTGVSCGAWRADATWASTFSQTSTGSFLKDRADIPSSSMQNRDNYESVAHPNLNMALGVTSGNLQFTTGTVTDEREQRNVLNTFNHGLVSPSLAPTPPKLPLSPAPDTNLSMIPQSRVARPPVEGRGRHQLLPRYWPRITDQELQQISGDSNCTIIPLFEKVLSASDAGRIGRLVLPKACAEAYFPTINQPEGLPLKIQDVKGKEWVFQFRYWPNNNSRMYVLEGVTPCIQSMQLQAGDTVTFSRKEPEGKLIMGFRKSSNSSMQNLPASNGSSSLVQPTKGSTDTPINALSKQLDSSGGNASLHTVEKCGEPIEEGLLSSSMTMTERKKGRNIGSKSKRLLIDNQDVQALRLTWDEMQGMLRPPQNANPSIVVIGDFEFEEYEEPPVVGKNSVFATRSSGVIEQWAQCDSCSKWRKLPAEVLLPPKWMCQDNIWDSTRCFCSAPDELSSRELELFCNLSKDSRKKRIGIPNNAVKEQGASGLSALANAAVSGDKPNEPGTSAVATTTRHPRHREGCQCIVCIQPPSGKGKHKSTCTCTVCMTVKRRFKTLMMRKKKRLSDQEAETLLKNQKKHNKGDDNIGVENDQLQPEHQHEGEDALQSGLAQTNDIQEIPIVELADCSSILDLNFHPEREEDSKIFMDLLQLASVPVESYMEQNGLASFTSKEQASSSALPGQVAAETERQPIEEHPASQAPSNQVNPSNGSCEPEFTSKQQGDS